MKILILGGTGMLGHQLVKYLSKEHEVAAPRRDLFDAQDERTNSIEKILDWFKPEVVINAIGLVKQREVNITDMIEVNALFPHRLAKAVVERGLRLIHFSTDCVLLGLLGPYTEGNSPMPKDTYGRTKAIGEVDYPGCLTLRTSIIGRELSRKLGLVEWLLGQRGKVVQGFLNAKYTGFTTLEMARIVNLILKHGRVDVLRGVWHVSSEAITKYDLLWLIKEHYGLPVTIMPEVLTRIDRRMDSSRFRMELGYTPPAWDDMIAELAQECPL